MEKRPIKIAFWAATFGATAALCAQILLRSLGPILSFDPQFSAIFAQIAGAKMGAPAIVLAALSVPAAYLLQRLPRWASVTLGILIWIILFLAAVLLTRVNDIRFVDVLVSLLDVLQKGGL